MVLSQRELFRKGLLFRTVTVLIAPLQAKIRRWTPLEVLVKGTERRGSGVRNHGHFENRADSKTPRREALPFARSWLGGELPAARYSSKQAPLRPCMCCVVALLTTLKLSVSASDRTAYEWIRSVRIMTAEGCNPPFYPPFDCEPEKMLDIARRLNADSIRCNTGSLTCGGTKSWSTQSVLCGWALMKAPTARRASRPRIGAR